MRIIGLIPARQGSKGIQNKNMVLCAGRPLISYTFRAALDSRHLERCFISTDAPRIADFAHESGIEVPFLRPQQLSDDDSAMIDVVAHFADWLNEAGVQFHGIQVLQPTSPMRTAQHIDEGIKLFQEKDPNSLVSVVKVPHNYTPESILLADNDSFVPYSRVLVFRRQDKRTYYARNGPAVLIVGKEAIRRKETYAEPCVGYEMDQRSSIDVDDYFSLKVAELLLKESMQEQE